MRFLTAVAFFPIRLLIVWPLRIGWTLLRWLVLASNGVGGWAVLIALIT
jgi:hypothetical protein